LRVFFLLLTLFFSYSCRAYDYYMYDGLIIITRFMIAQHKTLEQMASLS
jgi:hypothetical protein